MMRKRVTTFACWSWLILLVALLLVPAPGRAAPSHYFPESGHTLAEPFSTFWHNTPDPLQTLGYPISEPFVQQSFTEPGRAFRVQYFERAILEEQPAPRAERGARPSVVGRLLGAELTRTRASEAPFQPIMPAAVVAGHTWDSATRHTLSNQPAPFRRFVETRGGLPIFGRPLSEQFQERNRDTGQLHWVQYFERQRLEWHPAQPNLDQQVQLGRLGDEYRLAHAATLDPAPFRWRQSHEQPEEQFAYGFNATLYYTDQQQAAAMAAATGFRWVRQQVFWRVHQSVDGTISWDELDQIVAAVDGAGLKLLLCVVQAPDWAVGEPGATGFPAAAHRKDYAAFLAAIARRYGDKVAGFEIWNEMNLAQENGYRPVPPTADYVDLLAQAYDAIKAANPRALVVSGAPGPTEWHGGRDVAISDILFFREMFADPRFWSHTDVVGVHVFGYANPPDTLWPDDPGPGPEWRDSGEFYFRRVEAVREEMLRAGHPERQLWMTELGWATANDSPLHAFGNQNSFEDQAAYLLRAFEIGRNSYTPWLGAIFVWNLNFAVTWHGAGRPTHEQAAYGVINPDWTPRPAYTTLKNMAKP